MTCLTGIEEGAGQQAEIYNEAGKKKDVRITALVLLHSTEGIKRK